MFISHITLSGFSERVLFYILSGILTLAGFIALQYLIIIIGFPT